MKYPLSCSDRHVSELQEAYAQNIARFGVDNFGKIGGWQGARECSELLASSYPKEAENDPLEPAPESPSHVGCLRLLYF